MSDIKQKVKTQFARTSAAYVTSSIHAHGEDLERMLELAGDVRGKYVLDVATGAGHTALAFARAGAKVTATDLTPEMLESARAFIASQQVHEVSFLEASAEDLPFSDQVFDVVTCCIAAHHFADPERFVQEVARVLKPGGQFLLVDNISPVDVQLAACMNHIEKTRDPSHVWAYNIPTWIGYVTRANLEVYALQRFKRTKAFASWVQNAQAPEDKVQELERYILELPEEVQNYFSVVRENQKLVALSHDVLILQVLK